MKVKNELPLLVFDYGFKFQGSACNGFHDLTIFNAHISNIAISTIENVDYRCITQNTGKSDTINLLENSVLDNLRYLDYCKVLLFQAMVFH